jgi:hypothetical protein
VLVPAASQDELHGDAADTTATLEAAHVLPPMPSAEVAGKPAPSSTAALQGRQQGARREAAAQPLLLSPAWSPCRIPWQTPVPNYASPGLLGPLRSPRTLGAYSPAGFLGSPLALVPPTTATVGSGAPGGQRHGRGGSKSELVSPTVLSFFLKPCLLLSS